MDFFDLLTAIGGLCLFLFGMSVMGDALERRAGGTLKSVLVRITDRRLTGFLLGLGVTAVIQSSSATTVMVVGFVNSGLINLRQAVNVIMGANVGTTVTSWILSLSGISGDSFFVRLLEPTSFSPVLALIGIVKYMSGKNSQSKDTGMILLGFATLMFGMDTMTDAVAGLSEVPQFQNLLLVFSNPVFGVLAGALLTAIIQSSSASVGILQALSATEQMTLGMAVPIIMGQNIGTCVTALLSSIGANKNAKRAAVVHLLFNVIGTCIWLAVFLAVTSVLTLPVLDGAATQVSIAIVHTTFNLLCTAVMMPLAGWLEKMACLIVRDEKQADEPQITQLLDERLLTTPSVAIERSRQVANEMAKISFDSIRQSLTLIDAYDEQTLQEVRRKETDVDKYEDRLGSYLVKLSSKALSDADSRETSMLLYTISDLERISDHAVSAALSAQELNEKNLQISGAAKEEYEILSAALTELLYFTNRSFVYRDPDAAKAVEPLSETVTGLKEQIRSRHVIRMQKGICGIEAGFIWVDVLTCIERVAGHCANIAGSELEIGRDELALHGYSRRLHAEDAQFQENYRYYVGKYKLPQTDPILASDLPAGDKAGESRRLDHHDEE